MRDGESDSVVEEVARRTTSMVVPSSVLFFNVQGQNRLDGRLYAIKRIPIRSGSKMMDRITREVELLSQMNHENVVR